MRTRDSDIATVLALEEPARTLLKAIDAAWPAVERLEKGKYPAIDEVAYQLGATLEGDLTAGKQIIPGSLYEVVEALEVFRKAKGDQGAVDYHYLVGRCGQTVGQAAKELLDYDDEEHLQRVVELQRYAETAAR